ncbi:hypothetical protein PLESTB_001119400 [Pleodorina starrii]|uniref:Uncharacterized protein n=1 Tax=Pleodorina starrii TaxID=330485 RepID=A0A9W6F5J9_9CHLO|nr:hypothetical protein PLESTB_001119400 [Pleodorina starrii]GLC68793.1 hypothetical protein PLESTF_000737300 [Pleodorina starrii]
MKVTWLVIVFCLVANFGFHGRKLLRTVYGHGCPPVQWNRGEVPGYCSVFNTACMDHGSRIVIHDEKYQIDNVRRENTPSLPVVLWNMPIRLNAFPDALGGWQPGFNVHVRPASKMEPTPPLRHPSWSNCTLPVVLLVDYPYNYKLFVIKALTQIDQMFRVRSLAPGKDATLVLATPAGLALEPYHAVLLSPYSRRPLVTMSELGRRGMEGTPADWSGEGVRVHCFSQLLACKLDQQDGTAPQAAASAVLSHLGPSVPADPLGFGSAATDPHVLRVVVEERTASWRSIRNVRDILRACEEADARGFAAGPFTRIVCKALPAPYDSSPPATGTVDPSSPGAVAFRSALGAVSSAHLFVAAAGSSGAHAFFMNPDPARGGAGLVEVRPCGWGTEHAGRADGAQDAMAAQLQRGADTIRFFAYNVEDAAQCSPPDYQSQLLANRADLQLQQQTAAHPFQPKAPARYSPEELLVRDQHLTLRPGPLLAMLRHAAALLGDKAAYGAARDGGKLHGYAVAEGLLLGPAGLTQAALPALKNGPELIKVP